MLCCSPGPCVQPAPPHHVSAGGAEFRLDQVGLAWPLRGWGGWGVHGLGVTGAEGRKRRGPLSHLDPTGVGRSEEALVPGRL